MDRRDQERTELYLVDALKYFQGRTQKRNIGIAFVEAYWHKKPALQPTWTAVLINQAIYILTKIIADKSLTLHELDNLERILKILENAVPKDNPNCGYENIQKVMSEFTSEIMKNIEVKDKNLKKKIDEWKEKSMFKPADSGGQDAQRES